MVALTFSTTPKDAKAANPLVPKNLLLAFEKFVIGENVSWRQGTLSREFGLLGILDALGLEMKEKKALRYRRLPFKHMLASNSPYLPDTF